MGVVVGGTGAIRGFATWDSRFRGAKPLDRHRAVSWYEDNGFKYSVTFLDGLEFCVTKWNHDGLVDSQMRNRFGTIQTQFNNSPPWWWEAQDQIAPTAPWWKAEQR